MAGGDSTGGEQLGDLADRGVRHGDGVSDRSGGDRRLRRGLQNLEAVERLQLSGLVRASGWLRASLETVKVTPADSPVANYAFDVTPSSLVTAFITERGVCAASGPALAGLYRERSDTESHGGCSNT